jgi:hypothetical protein
MALWNSLSRWIHHRAASHSRLPHGSRRSRPRSCRPRVEVLEARTLLSVYLVDRLTDTGAGVGLAGDLRYCITQANANPGDDTITFGVTGTINLTGALPSLSSNIDIQGPGASSLTVRRDTGGEYRIFTVDSGTTVALSGLVITNGYDYGLGGGIYNNGMLTLNNSNVSSNGSGIGNTGTLTLNSSTISGNWDGGGIWNAGALTLNNTSVSDNYDVELDEAGGIYNYGTVTLNNSTLSGNECDWFGGGIYNNSGALTLNNSTVNGNRGSFGGGGIYNSGGTLTLNNSTLSGNYAGNGSRGGGVYGSLTARNTIIAGNTASSGPDLYGNLASQGHNLIGNTQGGSGFDATDLLDMDPLLGPLQDNGGPTRTHALLAGSPALYAGDPAQLGVPDQRGVVRAGGVNIGAYQASASALVVTVPGTVTSATPFDVTVQAVDVFGQVAFGYRGTVTFSVTDPDPAVVLPPDYTFRADDQGTHTFTGEFTLITPGMWTLTTADLFNGLTQDVMLTVNP